MSKKNTYSIYCMACKTCDDKALTDYVGNKDIFKDPHYWEPYDSHEDHKIGLLEIKKSYKEYKIR